MTNENAGEPTVLVDNNDLDWHKDLMVTGMVTLLTQTDVATLDGNALLMNLDFGTTTAGI